MDNGSEDGSVAYVRESISLGAADLSCGEYGILRSCQCGNPGIPGEYVVLLNNDTEAEAEFLKALYDGIRAKENAFSCAALMLQFQERELVDDAGNFYNALGWAFARGKGKSEERYQKECGFFLPVEARQSIGRNWWKSWDILMRSILLIWKIRIWAIGRRFVGMKTGIFQRLGVYHVGAESPFPIQSV